MLTTLHTGCVCVFALLIYTIQYIFVRRDTEPDTAHISGILNFFSDLFNLKKDLVTKTDHTNARKRCQDDLSYRYHIKTESLKSTVFKPSNHN